MAGRDLIPNAISTRIARLKRDIWLNAALGVMAVLLGAGTFAYLWLTQAESETLFIKELAGQAMSLAVVGAGGYLVTRFLALRGEVAECEEFLTLYTSAQGPPPHELFVKIRDKVVEWLI